MMDVESLVRAIQLCVANVGDRRGLNDRWFI